MFQLGQRDNHYRNQNLKVLPVLPQLTILDLSGNLFTVIPMQVFNMQLKKLIFRDNLLTCISEDIGKLVTLEYLDVSYNYIRRIPNNMDKLLQLKYCNFNSNFIDEFEFGLFELQLTFLGVAKNRFTMIPHQISKLMTTLQQLELDWLHYCNQSYFIDDPLRYRIIEVFTYDCTFEQFYHNFMKQPFDSNFEKILTNHSLGLLTLHVKQAKQITMKNLIFAVSQQPTKENMKCLYYLIELLADYDLELLNIIYVLAARMNQAYILDKLVQYPIDLHYSIKFDLICHHKILIIKGQTPYTTLLQHNKNLEAILDAWVRRGFRPNLKQQGENCLHIAIKHSYYEGVKWALKYCNPNKQESSLKNTPLHILFQRQQSIEVFFLLENSRVNPFIVNIHNRIPRFYQTQMVQLRFVKLYLKYEKCFMRDHILNYNSNNLHEMIQSGSRNNCRECENSGMFSVDTAILITVQSFEQILGEISKIIRATKSINMIIDKFNTSLFTMPDYQGKFYYLTFYYLLKAKVKFGWKYVPSFLIVVLINTLTTNHMNTILQKQFYENQQQSIKQHKTQVQQQYQIQQKADLEQDQLIHLSQKLKFNLQNIMDPQINQKFFENSIIQYLQVAYLNEKQSIEQRYDNISLLNQYEIFQANHKTQKIRKINHIKQEECANIPESPKHTLNDKMKQAQIVNAKFKDFQDQSKQRAKSQMEI